MTWSKPSLTWWLHLGGLPANLRQRELEPAVARCFAAWEEAGVFTFRMGSYREKIDIHVRFGGAVFDGRGGVLGRAFPPGHESGLGGMVFIDEAERWTLTWWDVSRFYLPSTLMHEIGHVLGLGHGSAGAMRPHYSRGRTVTAHDHARLRAVYGEKIAAGWP